MKVGETVAYRAHEPLRPYDKQWNPVIPDKTGEQNFSEDKDVDPDLFSKTRPNMSDELKFKNKPLSTNRRGYPNTWAMAEVNMLETMTIGETVKVVADHFAVGDKVVCPKSGKKGTVQAIKNEGHPTEIYVARMDDGSEQEFEPDCLMKV